MGGSGGNVAEAPATVIPDPAITKFGVYPNPVTDKVLISFSDINIQEKDVRLYDLPGRLQHIKQFSKMSTNSATLDVSNLIPGVYILSVRVKNENKTAIIIKL